MISIPDLIELVKVDIPDAEVSVMDKTGMSDHFIIHVTSKQLEGMNVMARHRLVQGSLNAAVADGRVHAAEIKTETPS
jgi:acid stress-induced BolA-like protein IbaG/YrbA